MTKLLNSSQQCGKILNKEEMGMKAEIIFLYNNHRCHAEVVEKLSVEKTWKTFVGRVDGYEIYRTCGVHFNQFGFEAIKK